MVRRVLLTLLAVSLGGNGLYMLVSPEHWYHSLESVRHSGAFNAHFVRDIGCAYLAAAVGLAFGAWRPAWLIPGTVTALIFLGAHAGLHLWESWISHTDAAAHAGVIDSVGVYGPALLALALVAVEFARRMHKSNESGVMQ